MENSISKPQYSADINEIKENLDLIISFLNKFCKLRADSDVSGVSPVSEDNNSIYRQRISILIANPIPYRANVVSFYYDNAVILNAEKIYNISVTDSNRLSVLKTEGIYNFNYSTPKEYYDQRELNGLFNNLLTSTTGNISVLFKDFLTNKILLKAGGKNNKKYKSTKNKVNVIINKKSFIKTIYKNSNNVNYIKINKEYKLLSKFKVLTA